MSSYNKKEVIFLVETPLTERDVKRFGIQNWINRGWNVRVFDITKFTYPEYWRDIDGEKLSCIFDGLTVFNNINQILFEINNLQNKIVFIDLLDFKKTNVKIKKSAQAQGVVVKLRLGHTPKIQTSRTFVEILNLFIDPILTLKKLILLTKNKLKQIRAKKFNPDYLVVGGKKSMSNINYNKTSVIKAHNLDYDSFIGRKEVTPSKNSNLLVFLDEDAGYHPDYKVQNIKPFVTADNYYPIMDYGLKKIANSLKLNIKIAAHPRSNYDLKLLKFKNPIHINKTFELIKDAALVVGHSSTALQYAVIMRKPIIIVTTDEIQKAPYAKHWKQYIDGCAATLEKKVINFNDLSNINNFEDYLNVDDKKYESYIEDFIKTKGSPEKQIWDIVIEHIQRDLISRKSSTF